MLSQRSQDKQKEIERLRLDRQLEMLGQHVLLSFGEATRMGFAVGSRLGIALATALDEIERCKKFCTD